MKNFRLFAIATMFAVSTVAVASEAPVADAVKVEAPVADAAKVEAPVADAAKVEAPAADVAKVEAPAADVAKVVARSWSKFGSDMMTDVQGRAMYLPNKANAACNSVNQMMFALNAENKTYAEMFKSHATQITVASVVAAAVVYAVYQYANKPATKKAKN